MAFLFSFDCDSPADPRLARPRSAHFGEAVADFLGVQRRLLPGGDLVDFRGDAVTLRDSLEVALIEGVGELLG